MKNEKATYINSYRLNVALFITQCLKTVPQANVRPKAYIDVWGDSNF